MPAEKTKEPTPMSMSEVPQFSTLAKRRGKTLKSTASMAAQVMTIMVPLYVVTKGLMGRGSRASLWPAPFGVGFLRVLSLCSLDDPSGVSAAGMRRRAFRRTRLFEYKVVAKRMAAQFRRKSTRHARGV